MKSDVILFEVYEDNSGFVRCYLIQGDKVQGFDGWERFGFGVLRCSLYNAFANRFDRIADDFEGVEFESDVKTALAQDRADSDLIVNARITPKGSSVVNVDIQCMGYAGMRAWGIKEDE